MDECPTLDTLQRFREGRLDESALLALRAHVERCPVCRQAFIASEPHTLEPSEPLTQPLSPPPSPRLALRLDVPGYEVLAELGRGGMGVVYKARHLALNRVVALKMIRSAEHASADEVLRFLAEARTVAALEHPHIVRIYEIGQHNNLPFFTLDLVEGGSLALHAGTAPLPARQAATLVAQIARGVAHAHERGIVHRDLKPENILLDPDGTARITDFGLARWLDSGQGLTRTGAIVGTPAYMAPEQAGGRSQEVGPLADVYAIGAILYRLLTGRPPFMAATDYDTLQLVIGSEPVPPRLLNPSVPRDLETIALKALSKDAPKRYESAAALAEDVQRYLDGMPIQARPVGTVERLTRWCRRRPALAGLTAAVALLLVAVSAGSTVSAVWMRQLREREREAAVQARNAEAEAVDAQRAAQTQLARLAGHNGITALEQDDHATALLWLAQGYRDDPDGRAGEGTHRTRLSFLLRQFPDLTQYLRLKGRFESAWLNDEADAVLTVADQTDGPKDSQEARIWDAMSGQPLTPALRPAFPIDVVALSPDRRWVLTGSRYERRFQVWEVATGKAVADPVIADAERGEQLYGAVFSPDGQRFATYHGDTSRGVGHARVWQSATSKPVTGELRHQEEVKDARFSQDGSKLVTAGEDDFVRVWEVPAGKQLLQLKHDHNVYLASFSPDGERILTATYQSWAGALPSRGLACVWDARTGKRLFSPVVHDSGVHDAKFSPDGRSFVTACQNHFRLWDATTGNPRTATMSHRDSVDSVRFSPDGEVLLARSRNGVRLWESKTGRPLTALMPQQGDFEAGFTRDGTAVRTVAADRLRGAELRTWQFTSALDRTLPLEHKERVGRAEFSPKGTSLLTITGYNFSSRPCAGLIWDTETREPLSRPAMHQSAVRSARFSRDGNRFVTGGWDGRARVWDARTGEPLSPPIEHPRAVEVVDFTPDGRHVLTCDSDYYTEGNLRFFDATTGKPATMPVRCPYLIAPPQFSPDGHRLMTVYADSLCLYDVGTGQPLGKPRGLSGQTFLDGRFLPEGLLLVTVDRTHQVRVWDGEHRPVSPSIAHDGPVTARLSHDGKHLATVRGTVLRIWDVKTGEPRTVPFTDHQKVHDFAFSPDGRFLATGVGSHSSQPAHARVWDAASGLPLTPPLRHGMDVFHVAFSPDGTRLVSASDDRTARLWDLRSLALPPDDWIALAQWLSGHRIDTTGGLVPLSAPAFQELHQRVLGDILPRTGHQSQPAPSAEERHRRAANRGEKTGDWGAAVFHLGRLIERQPNEVALKQRRAIAYANLGDWERARAEHDAYQLPASDVSLWHRRGTYHAERGEWEKAEADLGRAAKLDPSVASYFRQHALVLLHLGRKGDFQAIAKATLGRLDYDKMDSDELLSFLSTFALADAAVSDFSPVVKLGERKVRDVPKRCAPLHALGPVLVRAGQLKQAITTLNEACKIHGGTDSFSDCVFLALAHHRDGNPKEARRWLALAVAAQKIVRTWDARLEAQLLLAEAQLLIGPSEKAGD